MVDTKKEINCPACGKMMKKVFIDEYNFFVDICTDGCGGIFFDNREFAKFDEQCENADKIFEALKDKTFERAEDNETRICPACGGIMVKNYSSIKNTIVIDDCYQCGGKFLDGKELEQIRNEYSNDAERTKDVLTFLYSAIGDELDKNEAEGEAARLNKTNADRLAAVIRKFL